MDKVYNVRISWECSLIQYTLSLSLARQMKVSNSVPSVLAAARFPEFVALEFDISSGEWLQRARNKDQPLLLQRRQN